MKPLSNRAVFRGSVTFQTELESGITLSGSGGIKAEVPMNEERLREVVFQPVNIIGSLLSSLSRAGYGHQEESTGLDGHSKQAVKE